MALGLLSLLCTFENSTKCSKSIVRLRFFLRIANSSILFRNQKQRCNVALRNVIPKMNCIEKELR